MRALKCKALITLSLHAMVVKPLLVTPDQTSYSEMYIQSNQAREQIFNHLTSAIGYKQHRQG